MKKALFLVAAMILTSLNSPAARAAENWKGHTEAAPLEFGVMTGLSLTGTQSAWGLLGTAAYLLEPAGWADDVDDRVWLEMELGPAFFPGNLGTAFQYSAHLRWDFTMNEYWTFYGLGGLGGFGMTAAMGGAFGVHPRFGGGVEYQTKTALMFRGELSSEFMGVGIALNF